MRFSKQFLLPLFALFFVGLAYQNCAQDFNPQTYNGASATQNTPPEIVSAPLSRSVTLLSALNLMVEVKGANLKFAWYKNDVALETQTTNSLSIPQVAMTDAGTYRLDVSNDYGVVSANIVITVTTDPTQTPPVFTQSPTNVTGSAVIYIDLDKIVITIPGASPANQVTFTSNVTSAALPTLQWYRVTKNSAGVEVLTALTGETNPILKFLAVDTSEAGKYRIVATSAFGAEYRDVTLSFTKRIVTDLR